MINPVGFNPSQYQYLYPPEGTPASQPGSISDKVSVNEKPKSGDALLGKTTKDCKTWKNRKYQDVSNDPGVSFKVATHVSPDEASLAVSGHENEHVEHAQEEARKNGQEAVSTVQIYTAICPEWGRLYVSGGETTTVTKDKPEQPVDRLLPKPEPGQILNTLVWVSQQSGSPPRQSEAVS